MLFNSFSFAIFLPIVFALYWLVPPRLQWVVLLISSYFFYMCWKPEYVLLIFFTTLISYGGAILIKKRPTKQKLFLTLSLIVSLTVLFFFKYFNFFSSSITWGINGLFGASLDPILINVILPVGISFYTFQTLGYVIDVYRGTVEPEYHFGKYATFISFFPQLVAGPIERTANLLGQIKAEHSFDYAKASYGARLMLWGYFKKMVVADNLAVFVDAVYDAPTQHSGFSLIAATLFFAIQIYCDFSGYSDIAIGVAKLFEIDLMENFKTPYFATSVKQFWSRWHISLSTWFKDYIYIPLGGNRVSKIRHKLNLIITFLVSGLWHGASWSFIAWGGIHGVAQAATACLPKRKEPKPKKLFLEILKGLGVFAFVTASWTFFRAQTLSDAWYILTHGFAGISSPISYLRRGLVSMGMGMERFVICAASIFILFLFEAFSQKRDLIAWLGTRKKALSFAVCILAVFIILAWTPIKGNAQFIYFQF